MPQSEIPKELLIQDIRTSGATSGMWTRGRIMAIEAPPTEKGRKVDMPYRYRATSQLYPRPDRGHSC